MNTNVELQRSYRAEIDRLKQDLTLLQENKEDPNADKTLKKQIKELMVSLELIAMNYERHVGEYAQAVDVLKRENRSVSSINSFYYVQGLIYLSFLYLIFSNIKFKMDKLRKKHGQEQRAAKQQQVIEKSVEPKPVVVNNEVVSFDVEKECETLRELSQSATKETEII